MIVKVVIKDHDLSPGNSDFPDGILETYYLKDPDREKLDTLKKMVENRFDLDARENMTEAEARAAEDFEHDPWSGIEIFIAKNFETVKIDEEYEIKY